MTQRQAQNELQEIERIANAILRGDKIYEIRTSDVYNYMKLHGMKLPKGQTCGTHYQQRSYALIKARELFNNQINK